MNEKKMKFVIVSPRQNCGGPIVLHTLCKYLAEMGFNSKIFYSGIYEYKEDKKTIFWLKWIKNTIRDYKKSVIVRFNKKIVDKNPLQYSGYIDVPIKGCKRKLLPFVDKNTIVIYPEITYGNFLNAKNVVRWLLYYNRFYNKDNADSYEKNDLFFCYREVFNDAELNPDCKKLRTPYYNLDLYKQYNFGKREGKCYVIRKGAKRPDLPEKFDGIVIDDLIEKEKVDVFNKCEYCISYDTQTAYSGIASMCGCISIVLPEPGKRKEDYRGSEDESFGIAWSFDEKEISYAKQTREQLINEYKKINESGLESAKNFVEICKSYFFE